MNTIEFRGLVHRFARSRTPAIYNCGLAPRGSLQHASGGAASPLTGSVGAFGGRNDGQGQDRFPGERSGGRSMLYRCINFLHYC